MKSIALIPLRGGSKSIPKKNIKPMFGKPLCYWSIKAALESNIFEQVIISTDSLEIQEVVKSHFQEEIKDNSLTVFNRPEELATDTASTESVIFHTIDHFEDFDIFCLIQATSPLLSSKVLKQGIQKLSQGYDSALSVCRIKRFFWSEDGQPLNYKIEARPRRQDFRGTLVENGAFYFTKKSILLEQRNRLGGKIAVVEMPEESFLEIDEPEDFKIVEQILKRKNVETPPPYSQIEAVVIDVDGTMTDGGMYYGPEGEAFKKFNTQDAQGIELAREKGVKVFVLTAEDSPAVHARFKKVNVDFYEYAIKNKPEVLLEWAKINSINLGNTLYIGDDKGDYNAMKLCGFIACPSNAIPSIKEIAHYTSLKKGGDGAVRDIFTKTLGLV